MSREKPRRKPKKKKKPNKKKKVKKLSQTHFIWTWSPLVINFQGFIIIIIPFNLSYATHWTSHLIVTPTWRKSGESFHVDKRLRKESLPGKEEFWVNSWSLMVRRGDNLSLALTLSKISSKQKLEINATD